MAELAQPLDDFIQQAGWRGAACQPHAGDASSRRYYRLRRDGGSAMLMDARGDPAVTRRFARFADWLRARGYSAPEVLFADHETGLLLVEDLGDALLARLIARSPRRDAALSGLATDFLRTLQDHAPPADLDRLDGPGLAGLVALTPRWYLPASGLAPDDGADLLTCITRDHARLDDGRTVLSLRDYHAENLLWLPQRRGIARLGLLDFQDAVIAHPAYDLVSLLQDARRDVPPEIEVAMIARFTVGHPDPAAFGALYALHGAQRALRILGIFARLVLQDGKPRYLEFMPRVWSALERNLAHPELAELARIVRATLPAPTPEGLERMRAQCGTCPTP